jgi:hypothetical protein
MRGRQIEQAVDVNALLHRLLPETLSSPAKTSASHTNREPWLRCALFRVAQPCISAAVSAEKVKVGERITFHCQPLCVSEAAGGITYDRVAIGRPYMHNIWIPSMMFAMSKETTQVLRE